MMRRARSAGVELLERPVLVPVVSLQDWQQTLAQDLVASAHGRAIYNKLLPHPSPESLLDGSIQTR